MGVLKYAAVLSACAWFVLAAVPSSADSPFSYALIRPSCAPWDGGAIEVTLTKESAQCSRTDGPYLAIGVWRGFPIHDGQEINFEPRTSVGFASQCAKAGDCERAESGKIIFKKFQQGTGASGHYELHFKGGRTLTGDFDAKWCNDRVVCG
ncbi:MAG TPA: hypothetical protein VMP68_19335 [Candidatus Eisenbacteria bacterium]|nr:hypothetical protein [Candidatus Eisenbacteria bacterium]